MSRPRLKNPTHGEFIQKLTECRLVHVHHLASKSWKKTAEHFKESVRSVRTCSEFYVRHMGQRTQPALADVPHNTVKQMCAFFAINDMDSVREQLIRNHHSINTPINTGRKIPKKLLRLIMKASGLDWFVIKGHPVIHWKHQP